MLSIRQLFFSLSAIYIVLLVASLLVSRLLWFYPAEIQVQIEHQQHEIRSLESVLNIISNQLVAQADTHTQWVNTLYEHQNSNAYHHPSLGELAGVLPSNVEFAIAFNKNKKIVYAVQRIGLDLVNVADDFLQNFDVINANNLLAKRSQQDYLNINNELYLAASSPINEPSSNNKVGWVLLLQKLDQNLWQSLGQMADLTIQPIAPNLVTEAEQLPLSSAVHENMAFRVRCVFNLDKQPVFCLELAHNQWKKINVLDFNSNVVFSFIVFFPLAIFFVFINQILALVNRTMDLFKEFDGNSTLKPITFQYWLPIKELKEFKNTYNQLVSTIIKQQQQLELLSNTDKLTDIHNRRYFDLHFQNTWNRLKRHSMSAALIMVDIDFFKAYNDHYGHQQGDKALHAVAQALAGCARRVDEFTARYGGEEFAMIVFIDNEYELQQFKQRLAQAIEQLKIPHAHSTISEYLTVSAGIAWLQKSGQWVENYLIDDWLKAADQALYKAKGTGRNKMEVVTINQEFPFS